MKIFHALPLGCLLAIAPVAVVQADMDDLTNQCEECHGKGGNGTDPKVANIAGASEIYLQEALIAYKNGDRPAVKYKPKDGEESDMGAVTKDLSEDDINALAKHYAEQPYKPLEQTGDADLAAKGAKAFDKYCEKCHSEGGTLAEDDAGILAGQGRDYLEEQFVMFSDGSREMPKKMAKRWKKLDDKKTAAIIEFLVVGGK